jgi:excisionase family DNA binding protein
MQEIQGAEFLTIDEGARRYPIGRDRLRKLVAEGEIPSIRLGRRILVRVERIAEWMAAQEAGKEVTG